MRLVRTAGNGPEMALRRALHRAGLRFRVQHRVADLPRRTLDVAFTRARLAVFIDGCFWHACPVHVSWPRGNGPWWRNKLASNIARDRDTDRRLEQLGWTVLRLWEHMLVEDMVAAVKTAYSKAGIALSPRATAGNSA